MASHIWSISLRVGFALLVGPLVLILAQAPAPLYGAHATTAMAAMAPGGQTGVQILEGLYLLALVAALPGLILGRAAHPLRPDKAIVALWVPAVYLAILGVPLAMASGGPGGMLVSSAGAGALLLIPPLATRTGRWLEWMTRRHHEAAEALASGWAVASIVLLRAAHPEWLLAHYAPPGHRLPFEIPILSVMPSGEAFARVIPAPLLARIHLPPLLALVALGLVANVIALRRHSDAQGDTATPEPSSFLPAQLALAGGTVLLLIEAAGGAGPALVQSRMIRGIAIEGAYLALLARAAWEVTGRMGRAERVLIPTAILFVWLWPKLGNLSQQTVLAPALTILVTALATPVMARTAGEGVAGDGSAPIYALGYGAAALLMLALDATHWRFIAQGLGAGWRDILWIVDGCLRLAVLGGVATVSAVLEPVTTGAPQVTAMPLDRVSKTA